MIKNRQQNFLLNQQISFCSVWLFQETERVSSDRIFRVQAKQPHDVTHNKKLSQIDNSASDKVHVPVQQAEYILIGDLCSFKLTNVTQSATAFEIGRVLQIIKYDRNGKKIPYKGNYASTKDDCFVLCTWYMHESTKPKRLFKLNLSDASAGVYHPISTYICTLSKQSCIEQTKHTTTPPHSKYQIACTHSAVAVPEEFLITVACQEAILTFISTRPKVSIVPKKEAICDDNTKQWTKCGSIQLHAKDKAILSSGKELTDLHINAAQSLLKQQFEHINGLQSTLVQLKKPLESDSDVLQIVHINSNHWVVLSKIGSTSICYYDSLYNYLSLDAEKVIAQLFKMCTCTNVVDVDIMSVGKQSGSTDCGLYAIALSTALTFGIDPTTLHFYQEDMRSHLTECLEKKIMKLFPVLKTRRRAKRVSKTVTIFICPKCKRTDDGTKIVQCQSCNMWYHNTCVLEYNDDEDWYCSCTTNIPE